MRIVFLLVITCICNCAVYGRKMMMDRTEYFSRINMNLSWTIEMDTQSIYIEMVAPISISDDFSWIAFGLSDTGGMKGADMALISLYHEKVYDLHSVDFVLPQMDKIQNWKLMHLERFDTHSIIQIKRHLLTCDEEDFDIKTDRLKHNLMIAYNKNDPLLSETIDWKLSISLHPYYERKEVNLFVDEHVFMAQNDDASPYFDFVMNDFTISKSDGYTQYFCQMFNVSKPFYATGGEILDLTKHTLVHHVTLTYCENAEFDPFIKQCGSENSENYRIEMKCTMILGLSVGTSLTFPSEIHYFQKPGIYNLEIHFDLMAMSHSSVNEFNIAGSGLRAFCSDSPRKHQLGLFKMNVGDFTIPPKQKDYELSIAMYPRIESCAYPF